MQDRQIDIFDFQKHEEKHNTPTIHGAFYEWRVEGV